MLLLVTVICHIYSHIYNIEYFVIRLEEYIYVYIGPYICETVCTYVYVPLKMLCIVNYRQSAFSSCGILGKYFDLIDTVS